MIHKETTTEGDKRDTVIANKEKSKSPLTLTCKGYQPRSQQDVSRRGIFLRILSRPNGSR